MMEGGGFFLDFEAVRTASGEYDAPRRLTDKLPFTDVYLHAMVRDKDGRKMSKSLGNVIDPLEVIDGCPLQQLVDKLKAGNLRASEVKRAEEAFKADFPEGMPRCGTDALRVGLLAYTVQGRDINLDIKRVVGYRSFCNKLWNAVRFMLGTFDDYKASDNLWSQLKPLAGRDKFILSRLRRCVIDVNTCLTEYKFGEAVQAIYHFFLDDLCDVYVELVKPVMCYFGVPRCRGAFTPSARLVFIRRGRGWFFFGF
jgi:valyl-tRNA synthetase